MHGKGLSLTLLTAREDQMARIAFTLSRGILMPLEISSGVAPKESINLT